MIENNCAVNNKGFLYIRIKIKTLVMCIQKLKEINYQRIKD